MRATLRGRLEHELGVKFYVVNGVATPFKLGHRPLTPEDHAAAFLTFLQDHEFAGNKVQAKPLEEVLYPHFVKQMAWEPHSWRTVARRFGKLRGVRAGQADGRKGPSGCRHGPSPRVYYIPRPEEQEVAPVRSVPASAPATKLPAA